MIQFGKDSHIKSLFGLKKTFNDYSFNRDKNTKSQIALSLGTSLALPSPFFLLPCSTLTILTF